MSDKNIFDDLVMDDTPYEEIEPAAKEAPAKKTAAKPRAAAKPKDLDFSQVPFEKFPLSAVSGNVVASINPNSMSIPVLCVSPRGWVGPASLELPASDIEHLKNVIAELEKQASAK